MGATLSSLSESRECIPAGARIKTTLPEREMVLVATQFDAADLQRVGLALLDFLTAAKLSHGLLVDKHPSGAIRFRMHELSGTLAKLQAFLRSRGFKVYIASLLLTQCVLPVDPDSHDHLPLSHLGQIGAEGPS